MTATEATAGATDVWHAVLLLQGALPLLLGALAGRLVVRNSGRRIRGAVGTAGVIVLPLACMVGGSVGSLRPGLWDAIWFGAMGSFGIVLGGHEVVRRRGVRGVITALAVGVAVVAALELIVPDDGEAGLQVPGSDRWLAAGWPLPPGTLLLPRERWRSGRPPEPWLRTCDALFVVGGSHADAPWRRLAQVAPAPDLQLAIALAQARLPAPATPHAQQALGLILTMPREREVRLGRRLSCCAGRSPLAWIGGEPHLDCPVPRFRSAYSSKLAWLLHTSPAPLPARALLPRSRLARLLDRQVARLQLRFEPRDRPPVPRGQALAAIESAFRAHASAIGRPARVDRGAK